MSQYIVSARKYRPDNFKSVIGQTVLTTTLKNAILQHHLAHAYLFCGPRGVGKTTCARIFAKTINCSNLHPDGEACNECESCKSFNEQRSFSIFEMDAASNNGVDDIKELIKQVAIPPQIGKYSVYIIDEVHMLSNQAFNAFLKTLEEPPAYAVFILATTEKHKILPTIISRCQIYDFNRIQVNDTIGYLKYVAKSENVSIENEALAVIAQKADGAMRDALSIFDQIVSFCGQEVTYKQVIENLNVLDYEYYFRIVDLFLKNNFVDSLLILNEIINKGFDIQSFVMGLSSHFRDLLMGKDANTLKLLQVTSSVIDKYEEQAKLCDVDFLFKALEITSHCELNYRTSKNQRLLTELMVIKLCQIVPYTEKKSDEPILKSLEDTDYKTDTAVKVVSTQNYHSPATQNQQSTNPVLPPLAKIYNSLKINNLDTEISAKTTQNVDTLQQFKNEPFSQEKLNEAWLQYADTVANDSFFANTVRSIAPVKNGEGCNMSVYSENQFKEISDKKAEIEKFIANHLNNNAFAINIVKDTSILKSIQVKSPSERLEEMRHKNSNLDNLIQKLELEIKY
jgi:DNA polymerase-3 subunit gamma/tau